MRSRIFWIGLFVLLAYCCYVRPPSPVLGYVEDYCTDVVRQLMWENLKTNPVPAFRSDSIMAPEGNFFPFMSWPMERDWLGAYFWGWSKTIPFLWLYFSASLILSYLGVGFLLRKMQLSKVESWGMALCVTLFHVPRHYKIWRHFECLPQHWVYWAFFLDAWIWQRFLKTRKISVTLELWRLFLIVGTFGITGYYWGSMILEWAVVRLFMLREAVKEKASVEERGFSPSFILPLSLIGIWGVLVSVWLWPIAQEVWKLGSLQQPAGWFAHLGFFLRPLWLEPLFSRLKFISALDVPETVVSVGWFYWAPALIGIGVLIRKKELKRIAPFLTLLIIALLYASHAFPTFFILAFWKTIPFMKFFRVAARWGLFLPQILGVCILLSWPEIQDWVSKRKKLLFVFFFLSCIEWSQLLTPLDMLPALPDSAIQIFDAVKEKPGSTVLDLPFCVLAGNFACRDAYCPSFPLSSVGSCLHQFHEKKVFGFYASRMSEKECHFYARAPYETWFQAWGENRCFSDLEWDQFCEYLDNHSELSALFIYPDLWPVLEQEPCRTSLETRLGHPLGETSFPLITVRGGTGRAVHRLRWYSPVCKKRLGAKSLKSLEVNQE